MLGSDEIFGGFFFKRLVVVYRHHLAVCALRNIWDQTNTQGYPARVYKSYGAASGYSGRA
ncbi:MAG: hypothetical protein HOH80_20930 [Rhodospirillaceae bacterium]|nr:hypothetical protein [Rhodospirillaceae bacterium]